MAYNIDVEVSVRKDILDPEAKAILGALRSHDFAVSNLIVNKKFSFQLESISKDEAYDTAVRICEDFLANVIIQDYKIDISES